jgi:hypothetical protein
MSSKKNTRVARPVKRAQRGGPAERSPIIAAPVAYAQKQGFPLTSNRKRRVKNSELVATIDGSSALTVQRFQLNPGLANTFPWLAEIAGQWQQYRFHSLCFRFVTRTGTSTVGSIILSPDYNPNDPVPAGEAEASNTQDSVEDVVWKDLVCKLDPASMFPLGSRKMVRRSATGYDRNIYDAGCMNVVTLECADSSAIGKLWVDYDVELFVPQNSAHGALVGPPSAIQIQADEGMVCVTTVAKTWDDVTVDFNRIPDAEVDATTGEITLPEGWYKVTLYGSYGDSDAEVFQGSTYVRVNGSAQGDPAFFKANVPMGGQRHPFSLTRLVHAEEGDILTISSTLTGVAGTLGIYYGNLIVEVAM